MNFRPETTLSKLSVYITAFCFVAAVFASNVAAQKKPQAGKSASGTLSSTPNKTSNDIDKRPRLIAVIGADDLESELETAERKSAVKPKPEESAREKKEPVVSPETAKLERRVFEIINNYRKEKGLDPLNWNEDIAKIARMHSTNMATYNFFSHAGLDGSMVNDRADELGYSNWRAIGENIAFNQGYDKPADFACERWLLSSSHHKNIINTKWKESGVGVAITAEGKYYFTQVFILR